MIDENYYDLIRDSIAGSLWVGISTMTNGVGSAIQITKFVKELNPGIPICWGGVHPTLFSSQVVENEYCDYVCWGEGERFATEFTKCLEREGVLDNIQSLGYVGLDGKVQFSPRNYFVNINDLGMPHYDLLDMEKYLYRDFSTYSVKANPQKGKFIVITTGIGCPYRCTFCRDNHPSQKFRIKSLENLMENIDYVVKRWDPDVIHLQDDLFFSKKERFFGFLDEYDKRGYRLQWYSNCRANYIADSYLNDEVLDRIKDKVIFLFQRSALGRQAFPSIKRFLVKVCVLPDTCNILSKQLRV
jgi:radical SAM superfamily enzyme YgiQ (UPF0313 family)